MFELFSADGRRVVTYAQEECRLLRDRHIGTEHLLLGLLHEGIATSSALAAAGITLAGARERVGQSLEHIRTGPPDGHVPFTSAAKKTLQLALGTHSDSVMTPSHRRTCSERWWTPGRTPERRFSSASAWTSTRWPPRRMSWRRRASPKAGSPCSFRFDAPGTAGETSRSAPPSGQSQPGSELVAQIADLVAQRDALAVDLRRFGRHLDDCDRGAEDCSCGFQQVLDAL